MKYKASLDARLCPVVLFQVTGESLSAYGTVCPTGVAFASLIMRNHDDIHKTGSTYRISLSLEEDRDTAIGNMYRTFRYV